MPESPHFYNEGAFDFTEKDHDDKKKADQQDQELSKN